MSSREEGKLARTKSMNRQMKKTHFCAKPSRVIMHIMKSDKIVNCPLPVIEVDQDNFISLVQQKPEQGTEISKSDIPSNDIFLDSDGDKIVNCPLPVIEVDQDNFISLVQQKPEQGTGISKSDNPSNDIFLDSDEFESNSESDEGFRRFMRQITDDASIEESTANNIWSIESLDELEDESEACLITSSNIKKKEESTANNVWSIESLDELEDESEARLITSSNNKKKVLESNSESDQGFRRFMRQITDHASIEESTANNIWSIESLDELEDESEARLITSSNIIKKGTNPKKACPECNIFVSNLPRHLQGKHGMSNDECKQACFSIRKRKKTKFPGTAKCPFGECDNQQPYVRLDKHLRQKHGLSRTDKMFNKLVRSYTNDEHISKRPRIDVIYSSFSKKEAKNFHSFLTTVDGGDTSELNSRQQALKIRQMLNGMNISNMDELPTENATDKLEQWILNYVKTHSSSSVITYLSVYISYIKYISKTEIGKKNYTDFQQQIERFNKWKRGIMKHGLFKLKSSEQILEEDILFFKNSSVYQETIDLINKASINKPTRGQHANIRNVLFLLIILNTSCRSCVLANMSIKEFMEPVVHEYKENNFYVVRVKDHKTGAEHGAVNVVMPADIHNLIQKYCKDVRPIFGTSATSLFITSTGRKVESADIYSGINSVWKTVGFKTKIGPTLLRKTVTTKVHVDTEENYGEAVSRHNCHSEQSAIREYKTATMAKYSVKTSELNEGILTSNRHSITTNDKCNLMECSSLDALPTPDRGRGRQFFDDMQRNVIKEVFKDFINLKKIPRLSDIRNVIQENKNLTSSLGNKCCPIKIKGAIQNFVNKL